MTHLASLTTNFSEHRGNEVLRCMVPRQLKRDRREIDWRVPHQLKSRAFFDF